MNNVLWLIINNVFVEDQITDNAIHLFMRTVHNYLRSVFLSLYDSH